MDDAERQQGEERVLGFASARSSVGHDGGIKARGYSARNAAHCSMSARRRSNRSERR